MRPIRLIALLGILALMVTPALAQEEAAPEQMQAEGSISSLDVEGKTMNVGEQSFSWTDETQVLDPQGNVIAPSELKEGDRVRASYHMEDAQNMADKLEVLAPAPAAPAPGM